MALLALGAAALFLLLVLWTNVLAETVPLLARGATPVGIYLLVAAAIAGLITLGGTVAWDEGYLATLWMLSVLLPGIASLGIIVIYVGSQPSSPMHLEAAFLGSVVAVGIWLIAGSVLRMLAAAPTAQVRSYSDLVQRTRALSERLGRPTPAASIEADLDLLDCELGIGSPPGAGLRYASAHGYMALWRTLHHAEASSIGNVSDDEVIEAGYNDYLRLLHSKIPNRDELMNALRTALGTLDPASVQYLPAKPADASQPTAPAAAAVSATAGGARESTGKTGQKAADAASAAVATTLTSLFAALLRVRLVTERVATVLAAVLGMAAASDPAVPVPNPDSDPRSVAKGMVRSVRHTINEYRDGQWEELIRARNRLLRAILLGAVAAYVLTVLAVVEQVDVIPLATATAYFFVGGAVGLFHRVVIESKTETAGDDYGLFEARLIGTPLESGLAAVFGVVLVAFVASSTSGGQQTLSLTEIFSPTNVGAYVTAAAFGLAPNLLIGGLNNRIADIQKSLASSQSAGAVEKKGGDDSGSGDATSTGGH